MYLFRFIFPNSYLSFLHKSLKSTREIVSYCIWWLKFEISCSIKKVFGKTSQNSQIYTKGSHPDVFSQKMFLKILQYSQENIFAGFSFLTKLQAGNHKLAEAAAGVFKAGCS